LAAYGSEPSPGRGKAQSLSAEDAELRTPDNATLKDLASTEILRPLVEFL